MSRFSLSRRQLLLVGGMSAIAPILTACGASAPTAASTTAATPTAGAAPTTLAAATQPASAPTATPAVAPKAPTSQFAGVKLSGILASGAAPEQLYIKFADFEKLSGAKVDSSRRYGNDLWDVINREYASGSPTMDFHSAHTILSPVNFHNNYTIQSMISDADKKDFIPSVMDYMGAKGNIYMLPRWTDVQLLHYRSDLFKDPKEQDGFKTKFGTDLKVPETRDDFLKVAEFFTRPPDLHGFGVAAIHSTFAEWLISSGGEFMSKDLKAVWNSDKGVKVMQYFRELFQKTFPGGAAQWQHTDTSAAALQGRLAMWYEWPGNWSTYLDSAKSKVVDSVDVALKVYDGPTGRDKQVVYGGSWGWAFPAKAPNKDASYALIEFMASPDNQLFEQQKTGSLPVRTSIWNKAKEAAATDKDPRVKKRADLFEWTIQHFWAYPDREMPEGNGLRTKYLIPELEKALLGEKDVQAALNDSADNFNKAAKELGY